MAASAGDLTAVLNAFARQVDLVWEQYQALGPGGMAAAVIEPIDRLASELETLLDGPVPDGLDRAELVAAIRQATELSRRCVLLPQGLCFVSGEAGLVPRRDQIDAYAAARAVVHQAAQQLA